MDPIMAKVVETLPNMALPPKTALRLESEVETRNYLYLMSNNEFVKDQERWDKAMSDFWGVIKQMQKETEELEAML